ncbi:hypothetical protein KSS87_003556 [Heliosperma pusillum]|nr:hypothetical protein KSS87_003556 [Heliosperma pusillum]
MFSGPGLFSDIGRRPKDLLTKDYVSDQKFSISTFSESGVVFSSFPNARDEFLCSSDLAVGVRYDMAFTSTAVKKGGLSTGDVAALYKYKNTVANLKVDTESNISTTFTVTDIIPSTKTIASMKFPDYSSGKLEVQYFHNHATFTTALALNKSPLIDFTATLGTPTISFGVEAGYDTTSGAFTKYTAGVGLSKPESSASIIL